MSASALARLQGTTRDLASAASELLLTAVEDRPAHADAVAVDALGDAVTEFDGRSREAVAALLPVLGADGAPTTHTVAGALVKAEKAIDKALDAYWSGVMNCALFAELRSMAQRRDTEWKAWTGSVLSAADRCAPVVRAAHGALPHAWEELIHRAGLIRTVQADTIAYFYEENGND